MLVLWFSHKYGADMAAVGNLSRFKNRKEQNKALRGKDVQYNKNK